MRVKCKQWAWAQFPIPQGEHFLCFPQEQSSQIYCLLLHREPSILYLQPHSLLCHCIPFLVHVSLYLIFQLDFAFWSFFVFLVHILYSHIFGLKGECLLTNMLQQLDQKPPLLTSNRILLFSLIDWIFYYSLFNQHLLNVYYALCRNYVLLWRFRGDIYTPLLPLWSSQVSWTIWQSTSNNEQNCQIDGSPTQVHWPLWQI